MNIMIIFLLIILAIIIFLFLKKRKKPDPEKGAADYIGQMHYLVKHYLRNPEQCCFERSSSRGNNCCCGMEGILGLCC